MESDDDLLYDGDDYASDEIDNYDSSDEIEENIDGIVDLGLKEKNFAILKEEDVRLLQEAALANTGAVLGVSREEALVLMLHHKWRINDVHDRWFADQERVREAVGLLENPVVEFSNSKDCSLKKFFCKICMEKLPMAKSVSVACGHQFCDECWRTYIRTSINDGLGCLMLKCPEPSCGAAVGQDMVDRLVLEEEDKAKYLSYLVRSYVEENKKMKWCPAPGCDCAVELVLGSETYDVTCSCSYSFCWNCTEAAHRPVDCETVSKWMLKNSSEAENMNWILVNSKPCPKCKRPIEKNQGCMHMTCRMCHHQFCWLCLVQWSKHGETGGFYSCNSYEEQKKKKGIDEDERRRQLAKEYLEKYVHYHERWASNQSAVKKAEMEVQQMQNFNLEKLRAKYRQPYSQIVFILEAWKQIIECRRVLKWSYAYGYYLPEEEKTKKQFFEYLQGEAEAALEKLHHCTEKEILSFTPEEICPDYMSFQEFREKLVDLTRVTKNYFENLVKALENGLEDVEG